MNPSPRSERFELPPLRWVRVGLQYAVNLGRPGDRSVPQNHFGRVRVQQQRFSAHPYAITDRG